MKNRKVYYFTDRQRQGLEEAAHVIDFGVSLSVNAALNELYTAHMMLRESKYYQRNVKRLANNAYNAAQNRYAQMVSTMRSKEFFDAYADKVIDLAENDITLFRIGIKQTLDDAHYPDSELHSYMETARAMLDMAVVHFDSVVQRMNEKYNYYEHGQKYIPYNYGLQFSEFSCLDVAMAWGKVCTLINPSCPIKVNLNNERCTKLFDNIMCKFIDGKYIDACKSEAHEACPEFVENSIKMTK